MSQVRVNCDAVVRLSRLFVPRMLERKRGWVLVFAAIINSIVANSNAGFNAATRVFYAMARNGIAPI